MKKLLIGLFICLAIFILPANASERVRMGVYDLESSNISKDTALAVSEMMRAELFSTGRFVIVDKKNMEKVLKEQAFQQTGCTSSECAVEVGKILGVNIMATGSLTKLGNSINISVTLTDVEKSESIAIEKGSCDSEDKLADVVKRIAFSIAIKTPLTGKVVRVSNQESVVVDLGSTDNVSKGMKLMVNRIKEEIKDSTGKVIMREYEDVGEIELIDVQKDASRAKFFNRKLSVKEGDTVKVSDAVITNNSDTSKLIQQMQSSSGPGSGSFIDPAWRSLIIPGWGQFYNKDDFKGWLFLIAGVASAAGSISGYLDYTKKYDEYNMRTDPILIEESYQIANESYQKFSGAIKITAGIWALNLLDSVLSFDPKKHTAEGRNPNAMFCQINGIDSVKVGYTVKW
ncbi:MAG: hypothetical protein A2452_11710 [Candidatus Firestonebacteria bacterium RIFOXYC2_FULL_39_67]|nr:MAG: hypothetical protein A2536_07600 [Candidatus Firestonebacteria bacterium RIFOXYD2_FULL_39_29]OGF53887.1 MAG: hypothetical protein A2452_11710 [Candidatus Firestonebacteria bacterium RIFOXYC2_FULL_39_67]OGF57782.1 MAG: hypothetical protein A2497_04040 [Candidatus Firestonebacteria bacterium RifOxyC12_full_39_7]